MSFYQQKINTNPNNSFSEVKPKLVDSKIYKKIKMKKMEVKKNNIPYKISRACYNFFKSNISLIIILVFLMLLLLYRYNDVKERRKAGKLNYFN